MTLQMEASIPRENRGGLIIETARLVLRAPCKRDLDGIVELANNPRVAEMTATIPHPYTREDAESWLEKVNSGRGHSMVVFAKEETRVLAGVAGFGHRGEEHIPEIGYWIGEPFWGRGYATEASRALIDHAFSETDIDALNAACRIQNAASRRVIEKCGFQWTGTGLNQVKALNASVPVDRFVLERRTWESLRAWGASALPTFTKAG
ncbi:MAG: GNAT family N-acetyltransferase [Xanthobacteraceae bacterium]|nr:GNAT family N-acetyltransferase [Xanthobacteraceae bacterium]QYK44841.1 MAG: GNAT family N-acetyltransferase [Xanthobacteraceae bacterium]